MKIYNSKDEVLDTLWHALSKTQSELIISSSQDEQVNKMIERSFEAIEAAKLAIRGIYHTKNFF